MMGQVALRASHHWSREAAACTQMTGFKKTATAAGSGIVSIWKKQILVDIVDFLRRNRQLHGKSAN
jgi:hypothetical protein